MLEERLRVLDFGRYLQSMIFSNSANDGGKGIITTVGFWGSGDNARKIAILVTAMAGIALAATLVYSRRGSLKSPWSRQRRKLALSPQQWRSMFTPDGKFQDGGVKFLKIVRSGGIEPSIRAEVWPFLLGVYDLNCSEAERNAIKTQKRKEYEYLRREKHRVSRQHDKSCKKSIEVDCGNGEGCRIDKNPDSPGSKGVASTRQPRPIDEVIPDHEEKDHLLHEEASRTVMEEEEKSVITQAGTSAVYTESSDTDSIEESTSPQMPHYAEESEENDPSNTKSNSVKGNSSKAFKDEDFTTWQRIIRLDALRANAEWVVFSPTQATVSEGQARRLASDVGLEDYDHLEPYSVFHAARLVAILEAYALYDPEIGYCQGMSDLLAPIITVMEEDYDAFWCFVGFMRKARHNFRLDEVGIRRQLNTVSKILKSKDSQLFRHLEMLQADDCFFVYRMVVVLFRRELSFEQTLCLWEVMWADQAAIRAGIAKSTWGRARLGAPPTEDLLLYAIAACVLQKRKLIIEKYSSMDEIMRECNSMAGQLDVWKLLDDAHDLVVTLHDKI
ncbi:hypothetical protein AAC387_Pa01g3383 [Persea americana]